LLETQLRELKNKQALESNNKGADVKNEIATKERLLLDNARSIEDVKISISRNNNIINTLTAENNAIRQHWIAENEKQLTFDENEFNCPACKQPLPTDKIENSKKELTANFNLTKKTKLENIEKAGVENKSRIENAQKLIEGDKAKLETLQAQKATIEEQITDLNKSLTELLSRQKTEVENSEIKALENRIAEFVIDEAPKVDVDDLKSKKVSINASIDELKAKAADVAIVDKAMVLRGLLNEAEDMTEGSSHGARVAAWAHLGKHLGMFVDKTELSGSVHQEISNLTPEQVIERMKQKQDEY